MLVGLGHADLVCRDLERSLAFYAAVLGPLGLEPPALRAMVEAGDVGDVGLERLLGLRPRRLPQPERGEPSAGDRK